MIYTVTFNPSLDYSLELNSISLGEVNKAREAHMTPGGKGINVSVVLAGLNMDSIMLGFTAGFTGTELERSLSRAGYKSDFIRLPKGLTRINVKLLSGETTDINAEGPSIPKTCIEALYKKLDALCEGDILILSGSIPGSLPDYTYAAIAERLSGRGIDMIVDATGDLLLSTLPYKPFLIKPNRHELASLFSEKELNDTAVEKYARTLREKGARNVLVSMDSDGALLAAEDGSIIRVPAPHGQVLSTVGAGDSMIAGFVCGWLNTFSYREAALLGTAAGSATCFSYGLAHSSDIMALRKLM